MQKIIKHPCFGGGTCQGNHRIHLPVSRKCNMKCNYCHGNEYQHESSMEKIPGRTNFILTPHEALLYYKKMKNANPQIAVAGFAGPGENLYNETTFQTMELLKREFSDIILCLSTNGLLLEDRLELLSEYEVEFITITINGIRIETLEKIYSHIIDNGICYRGREAARIILSRQFAGLEKAAKKGIKVKINSVLIPGINDQEMEDLAARIKESGAFKMNIVPIIPQASFRDLPVPDPGYLNDIVNKCAQKINQMRHCNQCRADAVGPVVGHNVGNHNKLGHLRNTAR